jgi:hypothetical protein
MPTEAQVRASWQDATAVLHQTFKFAIQKLLVLQAQAQSDENSDFALSANTAIQAQRTQIANIINSAYSVLLPHLKAYVGDILLMPTNDPVQMINNLYDYFRSNSYTIQSRDFGLVASGVITPFSVSGTGQLLYLGQDPYGIGMENQHCEVKTIKCTAANAIGALENEESFNIYGGNGGIDSLGNIASNGGGLYYDMSGLTDVINNNSARISLLQNPSFRDFTAGISATDVAGLPGWTGSGTLGAFT